MAAIALATAPPALADTTITNTPPWNGIDGTGFGYPPYGVQTSGQTVTVPAAPDTTLESFTVYLQEPTSLVFRGEVYAWDSTLMHATGSALYESPPMQTTAAGYQAITFNPGVNLTAGAQYVLFVSVSRDYNAASQDVGNIGATVSDSYPGGGYFYMQNAGDTGQWTTKAWYSCSYCGTADLAFTATFSSPQHPTSTSVACSPGTVAAGQPSTCTATVTDAASSGQTTPTGTVTVGSGGPGSFTGSPCTLAETSPGVASCQVTYIPGASGTPTRADTITATYGGDSAHKSSSGTTTVTVQPTTNGDCMNGGWKNYGFANQGLCIKFVQTGS